MKSKEEVVQEFRIQSIQEAAMRVIARRGMSSATMQEIAEEAGVAKGTIYLYFRDREELVERTFEEAMARLMADIDVALDAGRTFEDKIRGVMTAKLGFFSKNREFFRLYMSLRLPEGTPERQRRQKKTCQPQYQARRRKLASVIREAMERGELREGDPDRIATFVVEGSTAVVLDRLNEEPARPEEADVDLLVGLILDGMRKRN